MMRILNEEIDKLMMGYDYTHNLGGLCQLDTRDH